jgi:polyisoprenoid-binding protein YceI
MTETTTEGARSTWAIDPSHTTVEFLAKHMMITKVRGHFTEVSGAIEVDEANPDRSKVEVTMKAASLDTGTQQRDDHLRSADFLDVEKYEDVTFRSTRVEGAYQREGDEFRVYGDLPLRGTTREVVLDAVYEGTGKDPWGGTRVSFSADTRIDRRDFGLTWNQALEAGGVLVSNEIRIHVEAQAVKQ